MNRSKSDPGATPDGPDTPVEQPDHAAVAARRQARHEAIRWWIKLVLQPMLLLLSAALLLAGLSLFQHLNWFSKSPSSDQVASTQAVAESVRYICPMMCTPPQSEPGRCPVCAMELVPATAGSNSGNSNYVEIDAVARRVAGIETAAVEARSTYRSIRAIGELSYDEGLLKTIAAYVDGRIERLYADYTGVVVRQGDPLALVYSPRLYSGQVEFLLAKNNNATSRSTTLQRLVPSAGNLQDSAKQRLLEFGMTSQQIAELERAGEANSRLSVCAPISGTVIEKLASEGEYVKEGQPIYRLADLSTVWLMLELFPDDAATIGYGQKVEATVQSLPGRTFNGRVAFIDPNVDPTTRTVGVRVAIPNPRGQLRIGDYAKAIINAPFGRSDGETNLIFDPDLANQWICPQHPTIVQASPGTCPLSGVELVPASQFGFTADAESNTSTLMVPRDAVLMAGDNSVVYVDVGKGRFEIRRVTLGARSGDYIVVRDGLKKGEEVAIRGNFLIDSQMQLAGNPSLIDPDRLEPPADDGMSSEIIKALAQLSSEDRAMAKRQRICPVTELPLGSMGTPPKVEVKGQVVFLCCSGCKESLLADPDMYLANLAKIAKLDDDETKAIEAALAKLSPEDRALARKQRTCPVADMPLGSMGPPQKVDVQGIPVFICCGGCRESLLQDPDKYLAKLAADSAEDESDDSLPPMDFSPVEVPILPEEDPARLQSEEHLESANRWRDGGNRARPSSETTAGTQSEVVR